LYHPVYVLVLTHLKETFSMYVRVIKLIEETCVVLDRTNVVWLKQSERDGHTDYF
jgi:hypothetical protein